MKEGDVIFLSASVPYRDEWIAGSQPAEIEEAIISIARAVFARKGRLLFGGHPSVSPLVSAVAGEYFPADPARLIRPVVTFQSEFFREMLPDETTEMVRMGWSAIEWTEDRRARSPSLELMRDLMLPRPSVPDAAFARNQLELPVAMIAVGGMEGIRDEALVFLSRRAQWGPRRIFCFKSGGGAAARLLAPSEERLWPPSLRDHPGPGDFSKLGVARENGDIVDIEAAWHESHPKLDFGDDAPFQPYAAIVQWLLDTQLDAGGPGLRAR